MSDGTFKILKSNRIAPPRSDAELRKLNEAFNESPEVISILQEFIDKSIIAIDEELANQQALYEMPRGDLYTAAKLAERSLLISMYKNLTKVVDDHQQE